MNINQYKITKYYTIPALNVRTPVQTLILDWEFEDISLRSHLRLTSPVQFYVNISMFGGSLLCCKQLI